jgi:hypothetical protein
MDKTLADYIKRVTEREALPLPLPPDNNYPVYPEDDGYDTPKNPYSPV